MSKAESRIWWWPLKPWWPKGMRTWPHYYAGCFSWRHCTIIPVRFLQSKNHRTCCLNHLSYWSEILFDGSQIVAFGEDNRFLSYEIGGQYLVTAKRAHKKRPGGACTEPTGLRVPSSRRTILGKRPVKFFSEETGPSSSISFLLLISLDSGQMVRSFLYYLKKVTLPDPGSVLLPWGFVVLLFWRENSQHIKNPAVKRFCRVERLALHPCEILLCSLGSNLHCSWSSFWHLYLLH